MSLPVILFCLWIVAAGATAMLPRRWQIYPGVGLLTAMPVLIVMIGMAHGWWWSALGFAVFASIFRNAFIYFWHRAHGAPAQSVADTLIEDRS